MKRFISLFIVFLIFSTVCYILMIIIVGNYAPVIFKKNLIYKLGGYGHMYSRVNEVEKYKNVDILFMGSSHCYRGFDPRIFEKFNYKVFNFGSSAQSPIQEQILLNQYLDQLNPKLIVFEMYPSIFESDGVEPTLDIVSNNKIDIKTMEMCFKTKNIKTYNTLIYSYYRQLFGLNTNFKESIIKDDDKYITGGFVEKKVTFYTPDSKNSSQSKYKLNDAQISVFKNILQNISKKKINYILVQAPIPKAIYDSYSNNNQIDSIFSSWGKYYNFNEILQLNDSSFYDSHHLNQIGVNVFNYSFIDILSKNKLVDK